MSLQCCSVLDLIWRGQHEQETPEKEEEEE